MSTTYIGVIPAPTECRVPPGAVVVELKICEACGFLFARRNRDRYCRACHAAPMVLDRSLELEILEELMAGEEPLQQ